MFHPFLIAQLMMEGFLPIACSDFLLPKLHVHRCIISLENSQEGPTAGSSFHIGKQVRKKSKRYNVSINQSFETVVAACHRQHGDHCWLYPPLIDAFRAIHDKTVTDSKQCEIGGGFITKTMDGQSVPVRLYSIEVWNVETGSLAAGELGYTVGSIYTSLTGFSSEDSAGSIQLATLGTLLVHNGFSVWDLGMEMPYKTALGSRLAPRDEFVRIVHSSRHRDVPLRLLPVRPPLQANNNNSTVDPGGVERLGCREVLDFRPTPQHAEDTAVNATQQQQQDAILVATSSIQLDLHDMQNIKR